MKANTADCVALSYEVKMIYVLLHHLTELPTTQPLPEWDAVYRNAILESHLIHSRVLIEFFCEGSDRSDDIVLSDFMESTWTPSGSELERLKSLVPEIHKRMAHLTLRRRTEFRWPSVAITGDLMTLTSQFLDRVREESPGLDTGLSHAEQARDFFFADYGDEYLLSISKHPNEL
jgi:hypothetical protein